MRSGSDGAVQLFSGFVRDAKDAKDAKDAGCYGWSARASGTYHWLQLQNLQNVTLSHIGLACCTLFFLGMKGWISWHLVTPHESQQKKVGLLLGPGRSHPSSQAVVWVGSSPRIQSRGSQVTQVFWGSFPFFFPFFLGFGVLVPMFLPILLGFLKNGSQQCDEVDDLWSSEQCTEHLGEHPPLRWGGWRVPTNYLDMLKWLCRCEFLGLIPFMPFGDFAQSFWKRIKAGLRRVLVSCKKTLLLDVAGLFDKMCCFFAEYSVCQANSRYIILIPQHHFAYFAKSRYHFFCQGCLLLLLLIPTSATTNSFPHPQPQLPCRKRLVMTFL